MTAVLDDIRRGTGLVPLDLPMLADFHIDLGFDLTGGRPDAGRAPHFDNAGRTADAATLRAQLRSADYCLAAVLEEGLPLTPYPFAQLAARCGLDEAACIARIAELQAHSIIRRFGVVVRHHELGLEANAMCVWDVPDDQVSALGRQLAREAAVTLCYRRRRVQPDWPYNLFCMIHGSAREEVLAAREALAARLGLDRHPHAVLFSCRRFKQTGARYLGAKDLAHV